MRRGLSVGLCGCICFASACGRGLASETDGELGSGGDSGATTGSGEAWCSSPFNLAAMSLDGGPLIVVQPGDFGATPSPQVSIFVSKSPVFLVKILPDGLASWSYALSSDQTGFFVSVFCHAGIDLDQPFDYGSLQKTSSEMELVPCVPGGGKVSEMTVDGKPSSAAAVCIYDGATVSITPLPADPDKGMGGFASDACTFLIKASDCL